MIRGGKGYEEGGGEEKKKMREKKEEIAEWAIWNEEKSVINPCYTN